MMKDPNQFEINFPEDKEEPKIRIIRREIITPERDERDSDSWDIYGRVRDRVASYETKQEHSPEYYEIKNLLEKSKTYTIAEIDKICGTKMDTRSQDGSRKLLETRSRLQKQNDPKAIELGRLMGKLTVVRTICRLLSKDPKACLKYLNDLNTKPGPGAYEVLNSPNYPRLVALINKELAQ